MVLRDLVRRCFEYAGKDVDRAHEIYHDDAVLEFASPESDSKALPTSGSGAASIGRRTLPGPTDHCT